MTSHAEQAILTVAGRDVPISNPHKVLFPQPGYTKLDLARYYIAVADGALRGAGGRPTVLVRYPDGIDGEFFYQKRAPRARPPWIDVVALRFPSGRSAEEGVPPDAAARRSWQRASGGKKSGTAYSSITTRTRRIARLRAHTRCAPRRKRGCLPR